ncbi:MAG: flavin reductase [Bacteroidales bacterium]|nr:MAG: flavin reductase [Bacteroidales bacterium]
MKELIEIPFVDFQPRIHHLWLNQWFLLTSGDYASNHYNTMTVAWGYFGIMWNKPTAVVVVRPTRYTYEFINRYDTFSLCSFDKSYHKDLNLLGSKSGRDGDKISETALTPGKSSKIEAPVFREAELIIECRKSYQHDFKPENFLNKSIDRNYPQKDYHRMFFGEILSIRGTEKYMAGQRQE